MVEQNFVVSPICRHILFRCNKRATAAVAGVTICECEVGGMLGGEVVEERYAQAQHNERVAYGCHPGNAKTVCSFCRGVLRKLFAQFSEFACGAPYCCLV